MKKNGCIGCRATNFVILFSFLKNLILNLSEVGDAKFSHKLSTFTTLPKYYTPLDKRSLIVPFLWKFLPCSHLTLRRVPENYEIKIGDTDGSSWIYWCKMSTFSFRPPKYRCKIPAIFLSSKNKYFLADEDWNMATIAHPQVHKTRTKKVCTALWILTLKKFWKILNQRISKGPVVPRIKRFIINRSRGTLWV